MATDNGSEILKRSIESKDGDIQREYASLPASSSTGVLIGDDTPTFKTPHAFSAELPSSKETKPQTASHVQQKCLTCKLTASAFKNRMYTAKIENTLGILDPEHYIELCRPLVQNEIESNLNVRKSGIKIGCALEGSYLKPTPGKEHVESFHFNSKMNTILQSSSINEIFDKIRDTILYNMEKFEEQKSCISLIAIHSLTVNVVAL